MASGMRREDWNGPMECKDCGRKFLYRDQCIEVMRWGAHNPGPKGGSEVCTGTLVPYERRALDPEIMALIDKVAYPYERDRKRPHYRRVIDDRWRDGALGVVKELREALWEKYGKK